jgi:hypothetical protein
VLTTRTQDRRHTDTAAIQLMGATIIQPMAGTVAPWSSEAAGAVATTMEAIGPAATMTETTRVATAPDIPVEATEVAINQAPIERQATKVAIER